MKTRLLLLSFVIFAAFARQLSAQVLPVSPSPSALNDKKVAAVWTYAQWASSEILRLNALLAAQPTTPAPSPAVNLAPLTQQVTNLSQQLSAASADLTTVRVQNADLQLRLGAIEQSTQAITQRIAEQRRVIMVGPGATWTVDANGDVSIPSQGIVGVSGVISIVPDTSTPPPDATVPPPVVTPPSVVVVTSTTYQESATRTWVLLQPAGTVTLNGVDTGITGVAGLYDDNVYVLAQTTAGAWFRYSGSAWVATSAPTTALPRKDK